MLSTKYSKKGNLVLADGTVFPGYIAGETKDVFGEIVFDTGMSGYQEMLTDPSYRGQILTFTYPLIGNYGVTPEHAQSNAVQVNGAVIKNLCHFPSSSNANIISLEEYFIQNKVTALVDVDTRSLAKHIRNCGAMMAIITTNLDVNAALHRLSKIAKYDETMLLAPATEFVHKPKKVKTKIALVDYGVKYNIIKHLNQLGGWVEIHKFFDIDKIIVENYDGLILSPGPGDPALLSKYIDQIASLIDSGLPILGICLGHQLIAKLFGATTYKLPFGHRGGNHPVQNIRTKRVIISAHNHGYGVAANSLPKEFEVTYIEINDDVIEGLKVINRPINTIQFHPEAAPGPWDTTYIFTNFATECINFNKSKVNQC